MIKKIIKIIKKILKLIFPKFFIQFLKNLLTDIEMLKYKKMTNYQIFENIYKKKLWCPEEEKKTYKFYSGIGSHHEEFTRIYLNKIKEFLLSFSSKPSVVDLGCGDFSIGSQLRKYCNKYIAIDIFGELINLNKIKYNDLDVDFRTLDITKDRLPMGDICFVRQVLQHFSNDLIKRFLNLMMGKYKYLIITEHLPKEDSFNPNIDITTGPNIRIHKNSGVVLTEEPFKLKVLNVKNICNIYPKSIKNFERINTKILKLN